MHKLLFRQLKKLYGDLEEQEVVPELAPLVGIVDRTYAQADADRKLLERSLDLTSQELLEANAELRHDRQELELRVRERTADLLRLNASLEREIAERREAETALRESERRYQALAESSPAGILHTDVRGRGLYANRQWCELSGRPLSAAKGAGWLDGIHTDDRRRVAREWKRIVREAQPRFEAEFRFAAPDGRVRWVVAQAVALAGADERPSGYILTATDLTDRREAEEAIRRSEEKFRALFEDSKDMIFMSRPDGRLLDVNPAGVEIFGYDSKKEMLAADSVEGVFLRPEDRGSLGELVRELDYVKELELEAKRRDGKTLTVLLTCTPVRRDDGSIVALRGILRDVTEQRELARRLQRAQKLEAIGRLAGGVAHDFNNLLTAIIGYCELMKMSLDPAAPATRHAQEIASAAKRGSDLTRHLLAFSRSQMMESRVLDLNQMVASAERLLGRVIGEDVELVTRLDPALDPVRTDASQLEQAILNLAINARDAMPQGGELRIETANVEITHAERWRHLGLEPGDYVTLAVQDCGIGIPESLHDQIFEPFFTTKQGGQGTGLGLSTVYGIVEQSGGRIEVHSQVGRGSRFEIYLPAADGTPVAAETEPVEARVPGGHETILLAEDEPSVRSFLAQFLQQQGYRVLSAADGEQALEVAEEADTPIHLLLTDVVMPRLNGIQLARRMLEREPDLKVILMSGYTGERAAESARLSEGEAEFMQKPFSTLDLGRKLRELLGPARTESEIRL